MKPGSDTRQKVFVAADQLLEQGVRPTQQNVRELIGSGSLTTINKALGDWWKTLGERISRRNDHPELPEPVLSAAGKLWDQALAYAEQRFGQRLAEVERQHLGQLEQLKHEDRARGDDVRQLQEQNARLLERSEQLAAQLDESQLERLRLEERLIRLTAEYEEAGRRLKQQERLQAGQGSARDAEELLDARVRLRIQEEEVRRLQTSNDRLADDNAQLRQQLQEQERASTARIHQLELELARLEIRREALAP
ncbi:hypothetical protein GCM10011348_04360 [Marinobacterium nitratireducens]|uniref:KfrA N-terminal DNA-binding domain-containing protein n=1 Tax=Marinobacterium nitratireducens TaxID=518897 RepID=A0A918DP97_9GAMM|nr:DNA-binding protein [Marinobacterium nitratireducens]GGO76649.1 hypothetical protein GCM10011348_04360 [Marinobacterium nitratireducens]